MSDFICGKLISSNKPVLEIDASVFLGLVKVSADHGLHVLFGCNVQGIILGMFEWSDQNERIEVPFLITGSPLESTSDSLLPLEADRDFDQRLHGLYTNLQSFFVAASRSGYFREGLLVFSTANGISDPYPIVTTTPDGLFQACVENLEIGGTLPNIHIVVEMK